MGTWWTVGVRVGAILIFCAGAGCSRIRQPEGSRAREDVVRTTGYCKCEQCCGWERNWLGRPVYASGANKGRVKKVGITASGTRARIGTIAADTDIYPFGSIIYVPGYGYGRVEDIGGEVNGGHLDLYFKSHSQAIEWGSQVKTIKVWLPSQAQNTRTVRAGL